MAGPRALPVGASAGAALMAAALALGTCAGAAERPNVLFIMSDDHAAQAISAYGGILARAAPTPNIDRIAKGGMLFENCFVTNSICTPSRAVIFTGKYSHLNGVYKFTALDQRQPTLPKMMRAARYHTGFVGKYHLHSNPVGFDYWSVLPGQGRYHSPQFVEMGDEHPSGWVRKGKRTTYEGHSSDVIADKAVAYLKGRAGTRQPFILFCHFKAPHDTWQCARRYEGLFKDVDIPEPANLFAHDDRRSEALKGCLQYIGSRWGNHTNFRQETGHLKGRDRIRAQYQLYIKKFLRCVRGVDDNVGRILDCLRESGLEKNTIVVYTADQGFFLGEHGYYDKRIMYEEALRMPLLVRWPGRVKAGSVNEDIVLNLDFAQTILDAAGVPAHEEMQGVSFLPLLGGRTPADWRRSMYYRYYVSHFKTPAHWGVRTRTHKLIHYNEIGKREMFDLRSDPSEMTNIYSDPAHADVRARLEAELARLQQRYGDDPKDVGNKPRTGFEK
jgi:arylsulfatase A-like enzyme